MRLALSIVVPTFERGEVLLETLDLLFGLVEADIVVVDQTPRPPREVARRLGAWDKAGMLRWIRREQPSIPAAMNAGLLAARSPIVLFLDDDIVPDRNLVAAHLKAHEAEPDAWAVVGQVLQPGEESGPVVRTREVGGFREGLDFSFWSNERAWVSNVMAGNLSVKREQALAIGGFDENFEGVAYRFETEFARRLIRAGGKILFEPAASLRHLRAERGGTRSQGSHLTSASPRHGMGDYYFAMQSGWTAETIGYMLRRPFREVTTRFHASHPWYVPVKLLGEARAFAAAWNKHRRGPKLIEPPRDLLEPPRLVESIESSRAPEALKGSALR